MRALILVLILGIIGIAVYTQFLTPLSEEEKEVKQLEDRFNSASSQFMGAVRIAGGTGLGTTSDAQDAIILVKKVRKEFMSLKERLEDEDAIKRAKKLEAKIKEFYEKNDLY